MRANAQRTRRGVAYEPLPSGARQKGRGFQVPRRSIGLHHWLARGLGVGLVLAGTGCPLLAGLDDLPASELDATMSGDRTIETGVKADASTDPKWGCLGERAVARAELY